MAERLLLGERKLAGILAERHPDGPVVVGTRAQRRLGARRAPPGSVTDVDPLDVLDALLARVRRACPPTIAPRYRQALDTLGRPVRVELADGVLEGVGHRRRARTGGWSWSTPVRVTHRIDAGDVVHLRAV